LKKRSFFCFQPQKETSLVLGALIVLTLINALANLFTGGLPYFLLYQGLFGIGVCVFFPLYYTVILKGETLEEIGLTTRKWLTAGLVALPFIALSIGGQLTKVVAWPTIDNMIYIGMGLIASTLFEEVFFRGFLQTRFEKAFGMIPAILISGAAFSFYHLGYPKFRNPEMLIVLFLVGTFFAISFSITRNVITSYLVNLPNAILTFFLKPTMLPEIHLDAAVVSIVAFTISIVVIMMIGKKKTIPMIKIAHR
jgi:membrane protease YdiL (CAAX protease family)